MEKRKRGRPKGSGKSIPTYMQGVRVDGLVKAFLETQPNRSKFILECIKESPLFIEYAEKIRQQHFVESQDSLF